MATVTLRLTPQRAHVRTARLVAAAMARRSGVPEELLDEVRLAVGEACSRAVQLHERYGVTDPVEVVLVDDQRFEVAVRDVAPTDPPEQYLADEPATGEPGRTGPAGPAGEATAGTATEDGPHQPGAAAGGEGGGKGGLSPGGLSSGGQIDGGQSGGKGERGGRGESGGEGTGGGEGGEGTGGGEGGEGTGGGEGGEGTGGGKAEGGAGAGGRGRSGVVDLPGMRAVNGAAGGTAGIPDWEAPLDAGLGLALLAALVEDITVEVMEGKSGTRVKMSWPVDRPATGGPAASAGQPPGPAR